MAGEATQPEGAQAGGADEPARRGRRVWWRARVSAAAALALVLIGGAILSWRWFVHPIRDGPVQADAIVMFGGAGERFDRVVELADAGWADVVVISDPIEDGDDDSKYEWFCRNDGSQPGYPVHHYEAICFDPDPVTTRGEARYVAELARERGWERVNLVTTVDQATRARMLLGRCWDGEIATVAVPTDAFRPGRILYEWGAMARATFQRRGC